MRARTAEQVQRAMLQEVPWRLLLDELVRRLLARVDEQVSADEDEDE